MPNRPRQPDGRIHGVVIAVHDEDGRWLLIRRSAQVGLAPLKVCFPGGGIEPGESHAAAAIREFHEELGGIIVPKREVWVWEDPIRPLKLFGWTADLISRELHPNPAEVAEIHWLTSAQAADHPDGLPGTAFFISALTTVLQSPHNSPAGAS